MPPALVGHPQRYASLLVIRVVSVDLAHGIGQQRFLNLGGRDSGTYPPSDTNSRLNARARSALAMVSGVSCHRRRASRCLAMERI